MGRPRSTTSPKIVRAADIGFLSEAAIASARDALARTQHRIAKSRALINEIQGQLAQFEPSAGPIVNAEMEIEALERLHRMTVCFLQKPAVGLLLDDALDALMGVTEAPMGNVQLLDRSTGELKIAVSHGFRSDFLDFFRSVRTDGSACAVALRDHRRVIVCDVTRDRVFTDESREVVLGAGVRALQSTPLVSVSGTLVGVVSTHYLTPRLANPRVLHLVDVYARQIGTLIESAPSLLTGESGAPPHRKDRATH